MIATIQAWLDLLAGNAAQIIVIVTMILSVIGLVRAQLKLWRAERAGAAVTSAVTASGSGPAVKGLMRAETAEIKATVKAWLKPPPPPAPA